MDNKKVAIILVLDKTLFKSIEEEASRRGLHACELIEEILEEWLEVEKIEDEIDEQLHNLLEQLNKRIDKIIDDVNKEDFEDF